MQPRPQMLSDTAQYFLDGASEYGDMLGAAATWLSLYGDRRMIEEAIGLTPTDSGYRARMACAHHLQREAFRDALAADEPWRAGFLASAALSGRRILFEIAEFYGEWFYEDSVWGGCALDFHRARVGRNSWLPTPKVARRLRSRDAIRRYITSAAARSTLDDHAATMADLRAQAIAYTDDAARFMSREWEKASRAWQIDASARARLDAEISRQYRRVFGGTSAPVEHAKRKPLLRAARLAEQVVGAEAVRAFVKGGKAAIAGDGLAFRVARAGSLTKAGHGALAIDVCDQDSGARLAGLCLYFDKTPALDQLAAIGLHIDAGEQAALLETGNLYDIHPEALAHPVIGPKIVEKAAARSARAERMLGQGRDNPRDEMRRAAGRYALEMFPVFQDVIADQIVGRQKKELLRCGVAPQEIALASMA